ncbi:hypothetical protein ACH34E_11550 [Elizabethkingia anophelis]|uniref:hypothetical protein n=1 Tax=Elizabethkingia anophelis TaxID=1117645 RepID=UPI000442B8D9|nr:hypothetical protein [Elizabethkingia anophelis]MCT3662522.1 hypothetical protein [Elizabethkingia anophelis]MCT3800580.1 hypothetical protein [Elizabethkingia anophelis]MCT4058264.1 hypothetical protein [Elizabethkingia anophelis]MCT4068873.1 hypothetical protein [Elizabethkingia anophelis]CDN73620.1 conserved membrane hypothetical protein [Elizabethkingia anophelis]
MKNLKIISIISFLLIGGVHEKAVINILAFPYMLVEFFGELFDGRLGVDMLSALLIVITLAGTLIVFYKSQNKSLLTLCFITLMLFSIYFSGILDHKPTIYFVVTFAIFIISSVMLIIRSPQQLEK